mgnify:CR=1 FL=1
MNASSPQASSPSAEQLLQAINELKAQVMELRTEMTWKQKIWLTAEETCKVLGIARKGVYATEPLRSLEHRIKVQYTRPKLYRSKDVFRLLEQLDNDEIALEYHGRRLVIVPLKASS